MFRSTVLRLFGLAALLTAVDSGAATIRVPQDFETIQAALSAAIDYDTILISLGTYAEEVHVPPKILTIRGDVVPDTGDYPRPVIDPSSLPGSGLLACLITITTAPQVYEDLVFRNGARAYEGRQMGVPGGVRNSGPRTFRRCVFDSNFRQTFFLSSKCLKKQNTFLQMTLMT